MIPKLLLPIPKQNYELARDRIAEILITELTSQYNMYSPPGEVPLIEKVWVERFTSFDNTDIPTVNVSFFGGPYENKNPRSVDGTYTYYVDVYTGSPETEEEISDTLAVLMMQRLIGCCRAILENPAYKTLAFDPGFIKRVYVKSIKTPPPVMDGDTLSLSRGRIEFIVETIESVEIPQPTLPATNYTTVKLNQTNQGYYFTFIPAA